MSRLGLGAPVDLPGALAWSEVAALERNALAGHERDALLAKLNPDQQQQGISRAKSIMALIKGQSKAAKS